MDKDYWRNKWATDDTRFHRTSAHPALTKYSQFTAGQRIFVPFCGKSLDLIWLMKQGCQIVASELSEVACDGFFQENAIQVSTRKEGAFVLYEAAGIKIWCGDHFALTPDVFDGVSGWYDRAALVALPEPMREKYFTHFFKVLPSFRRELFEMLLVSIEYEQERTQGPPFNVSESEIRSKLESTFDVHLLDRYQDETFASHPRFTEVPAGEAIYRIVPKR